jgi:hypothetical protein
VNAADLPADDDLSPRRDPEAPRGGRGRDGADKDAAAALGDDGPLVRPAADETQDAADTAEPADPDLSAGTPEPAAAVDPGRAAVDAAWADIVARLTAAGVAMGAEGADAAPAPTPNPAPRPVEPPAAVDEGWEDDEPFVPPPAPPIPAGEPATRYAWAAFLGGLGFLVLDALVRFDVTQGVRMIALLVTVGGFVTLVARMKDGGPEDGWDDGTRL